MLQIVLTYSFVDCFQLWVKLFFSRFPRVSPQRLKGLFVRAPLFLFYFVFKCSFFRCWLFTFLKLPLGRLPFTSSLLFVVVPVSIRVAVATIPFAFRFSFFVLTRLILPRKWEYRQLCLLFPQSNFSDCRDRYILPNGDGFLFLRPNLFWLRRLFDYYLKDLYPVRRAQLKVHKLYRRLYLWPNCPLCFPWRKFSEKIILLRAFPRCPSRHLSMPDAMQCYYCCIR